MSDSGDFGLPDDLAELPDGWDYQSLAELVDDERGICYGIVQPGSHTTEGIPIVRVNNIKTGRIDTSDMLRVTEDIESKYARSRLRGGEVLLTLVGSLGESAVVPPELAGWNVARAVGVIPVKQEIGPRWVELCLRSSGIQHFIHTRATTTVQATFNLRDVAKLPVPVPPKREREAISAVLGALDDKIELNRRVNETLEAMARAIFQNWFVNATQAGLPDGWRESRLGDVADVNWGDTNTTKASFSSKGFPAYSASGCDGYLPYHDFNQTGVIVSAIGANAGVSWLALGKWSCIKNTIRLWTTGDEVSTEYLFYATLGKDKWPLRGSAQPFIAQGDARAMKIIVPANRLANRFGELVQPLHLKMGANDDESRTLAALRDALLPQLLSGELRVPAAV